MKISNDEKETIVQGLDDLYGNNPIAYLKFCDKEKFADDICKGLLYANTPKYFRDKEIQSGVRGQGDKNECLSAQEVENICMVDHKTGLTMFTAQKGQLKIGIKKDDTISLVCFFGLRIKELTLISFDEYHAVFQIPLDLIKEMKAFGDYCVVIQTKELDEHIAKYCEMAKVQYIFQEVTYCQQNRIDRINSFNNATIQRLIYKDEDLAYQHEYRLAIDMECPEDHYIRIGKLKNVVSLMAEDLYKIKIDIRYKT